MIGAGARSGDHCSMLGLIQSSRSPPVTSTPAGPQTIILASRHAWSVSIYCTIRRTRTYEAPYLWDGSGKLAFGPQLPVPSCQVKSVQPAKLIRSTHGEQWSCRCC
ncbi:hypothetical protein M758_2G040200 [Ceratodon purpureus]|nr:hypothetical protein M758_2G040200 [Ceratodon purpureus]